MIKPGVIDSDQDSVHSQEEAKQQEETSRHHPLNPHNHTNKQLHLHNMVLRCFGEKQLEQKLHYIPVRKI